MLEVDEPDVEIESPGRGRRRDRRGRGGHRRRRRRPGGRRREGREAHAEARSGAPQAGRREEADLGLARAQEAGQEGRRARRRRRRGGGVAMLMPKRTKHRKLHRGRRTGAAQRGNKLDFGTYGLQAIEQCWMTNRQIEAARRAMTRHVKRGGKIWIRDLPRPRLHEEAGRDPDGKRQGPARGLGRRGASRAACSSRWPASPARPPRRRCASPRSSCRSRPASCSARRPAPTWRRRRYDQADRGAHRVAPHDRGRARRPPAASSAGGSSRCASSRRPDRSRTTARCARSGTRSHAR